MTEVFAVVRDQQDNYEVTVVCATEALAEKMRRIYVDGEVVAFTVMLRDAWAKKLAKVGFHSAAPSAEERETKLERMEIEAETRVVRWPVLRTLIPLGGAREDFNEPQATD